jgi:four helix bundle protein
MKYKRFEDLPVWQSAMDLASAVFELVENSLFSGQGDLRDQLQRASLSISNNIAEGFERGTTQELLTFLCYARGSAGETRSMLTFCERRRRYADLGPGIKRLLAISESCSRQLRAWADTLQNSEIKGQRHLSDKVRQQDQQQRRAKAFIARLDAMRKGARPSDSANDSIDSE